MAADNLHHWDSDIAEYMKRYAVAAVDQADAHRPLWATHKLEQILSLRTERTVMNDYTLSDNNKF